MTDILIGELYLIHYFGVNHRDFEPRNVLRKGWCRLTVIDFAFSNVDHTCPGWRERGELKDVWHKLGWKGWHSATEMGGGCKYVFWSFRHLHLARFHHTLGQFISGGPTYGLENVAAATVIPVIVLFLRAVNIPTVREKQNECTADGRWIA